MICAFRARLLIRRPTEEESDPRDGQADWNRRPGSAGNAERPTKEDERYRRQCEDGHFPATEEPEDDEHEASDASRYAAH